MTQVSGIEVALHHLGVVVGKRQRGAIARAAARGLATRQGVVRLTTSCVRSSRESRLQADDNERPSHET